MTGSRFRRGGADRARVLLATGALALSAAGLGGCGGEDGGGDLVWAADPRVLVPPTLPDDRILRGVVRNDSLTPIELDASDLRLVAGDGERLTGSAAFLSSFIRSVEPYNSGPQRLPEDELERLGRKLKLRPGARAPLTVSWRERQGRPARISYGTGSLPVPAEP